MSILALLGTIIPLAVAILGAAAANVFNIQLESKRAYLKRTSDQLQYLYGPLRALTYASGAAWSSFIKRYGKDGKLYFQVDPVDPEEVRRWRNWIINVFSPLHEKMEKIIIENTHLLEGDMPVEFILLLAHIETYKAVISDMDRGQSFR